MINKKVLVYQDDIKDCGVCSLLTIIRFYKGNVSKEYLRELSFTSKSGTTAYNLIETARKIGFNANGVNGDILKVDNKMLPMIAHVIINKSYKHFVVVFKINKLKKKITYFDPACGIKTISISDWESISTCNYLILSKVRPIPKFRKSKSLMEIVLDIFISYKKLFISIVILSLIYTGLNILLAYYFKFIIDNMDYKNNLYLIGALMIFLTINKVFINFFRGNIINYINHHLDKTLIKDVYAQIISLPYLYYRNRTTGEVITRINDLGDVKEVISSLLITITVDMILVFSILIILFNISIQLSLYVLLIGILTIGIVFIFSPFLNKYIKASQENMGVVNNHLVETIGGIETIKGLSLEENSINKLDILYSKFSNSSFKLNMMFNKENFFKDMINLLGCAIITLIGALMVFDNKLSIGSLITFNGLIIYFLEPIQNFVSLEIKLKLSKNSLRRVLELYEIPKEESLITPKITSLSLEGIIKISDLYYSYNGKNNVLNGVNLEINKGDKVLLYGNSGSGKSTLIKILLKFIDEYDGIITFDNKELKDYEIKEFRDNICYISQNETIFTDSVYNNITIKGNVSYDSFLEIAKLTLTDEVVSHDMLRYNMLLEENGFNISGGERQRIILARSLLLLKNIVIIDEGLNQIDYEKERIILKNIFDKYKDKTFIIVSHRFNNNDLFNRKFKLDGGSIYEY